MAEKRAIRTAMMEKVFARLLLLCAVFVFLAAIFGFLQVVVCLEGRRCDFPEEVPIALLNPIWFLSHRRRHQQQKNQPIPYLRSQSPGIRLKSVHWIRGPSAGIRG
jgi:hypothetical protein